MSDDDDHGPDDDREIDWLRVILFLAFMSYVTHCNLQMWGVVK